MDKVKFWRYSIPPENNIEGWGIFILDSTGMFAAVTDYGNYAYKWNCHGHDDFRKFFLDASKNSGYFAEKLLYGVGREREFDGENTKKEIKNHILENHRDGTYTKEFAREEFDLLSTYDFDSEIDFAPWYQTTDIEDAHELMHYKIPADVRAMGKKLLPRLAAAIKEELINEGLLDN